MNRLAMSLLALVSMAALAESPAVIDGNGALVGSYVGPAGSLVSWFGPPLDGQSQRSLRVVSVKGFIFGLQQASGRITSTIEFPGGGDFSGEGQFLFFETTDCTGQAYVEVGITDYGVTARGGFLVSNPSGLWYAAKTATPSTILIRSNLLEGNSPASCNVQNSTKTVMPVLPNDPNVTGIVGPTIVTPITISQAIVPRPLFKDGFEQVPS